MACQGTVLSSRDPLLCLPTPPPPSSLSILNAVLFAGLRVPCVFPVLFLWLSLPVSLPLWVPVYFSGYWFLPSWCPSQTGLLSLSFSLSLSFPSHSATSPSALCLPSLKLLSLLGSCHPLPGPLYLSLPTPPSCFDSHPSPSLSVCLVWLPPSHVPPPWLPDGSSSFLPV